MTKFTMCENPFKGMNFGTAEPECEVCEEPNAKYRCGACFKTYYCGQKCQRDDWKRHKDHICYKLDKDTFNNKENVALFKAHRKNLLVEFKALSYRIDNYNDKANVFQYGRWHIYKAVISMIMMNPKTGKLPENPTTDELKIYEQYKKDIIEGGKLINQEGKESIRDALLWSFLPQFLHLDIANILEDAGLLNKQLGGKKVNVVFH